jgi:hypothetical protein
MNNKIMILQSMSAEYALLYKKGLKLKSEKARRKTFDRVEDLRVQFGLKLADEVNYGAEIVLKSNFTATQRYPFSCGMIHKGAKVKILDCTAQGVNVAVPTAAYPEGEVFHVDFLDGAMGQLNLANIGEFLK